MKRFLTSLFILTLLSTLLTSCGGVKDVAEEVSGGDALTDNKDDKKSDSDGLTSDGNGYNAKADISAKSIKDSVSFKEGILTIDPTILRSVYYFLGDEEIQVDDNGIIDFNSILKGKEVGAYSFIIKEKTTEGKPGEVITTFTVDKNADGSITVKDADGNLVDVKKDEGVDPEAQKFLALQGKKLADGDMEITCTDAPSDTQWFVDGKKVEELDGKDSVKLSDLVKDGKPHTITAKSPAQGKEGSLGAPVTLEKTQSPVALNLTTSPQNDGNMLVNCDSILPVEWSVDGKKIEDQTGPQLDLAKALGNTKDIAPHKIVAKAQGMKDGVLEGVTFPQAKDPLTVEIDPVTGDLKVKDAAEGATYQWSAKQDSEDYVPLDATVNKGPSINKQAALDILGEKADKAKDTEVKVTDSTGREGTVTIPGEKKKDDTPDSGFLSTKGFNQIKDTISKAKRNQSVIKQFGTIENLLRIVEEKDGNVLSFVITNHFQTGKSVMTFTDEVLNNLAATFWGTKDYYIAILSHASASGENAKNLSLSRKRSTEVFQSLSSDEYALPVERILFVDGFGEEHRITQENNSALDRRTEIYVFHPSWAGITPDANGVIAEADKAKVAAKIAEIYKCSGTCGHK
ncbi:MAG: OmpA family protein [Bacteriovoracaceae bacterium]|nr:OmpA family protein [Bacteriovoracaceae bacterium]